ncbi:hypothetical protein [Pseudogemmobacter bohemicus]|uniref:hypothetical protein n=1 Tax=Pseudogemmobacter bohemicus TaxID=2250708 RepID=UPI000DD390BA|nr:hypothetical protein [Pseudogemmobacter bohemicus]
MAFDLFTLRQEEDFRDLNGAKALDAFVQGVTEAREFPRVDLWKPPGPVAHRFFLCDDDVIGIRGPVGSGKTTAHLRSRIRRAQMMPRSGIDGIRRYKVAIVRETYRQLWSTTIPSWWEVMPKKLGSWAGGRGDPVTHSIRFEDQWGPIEFIAEFMAFGSAPAEIDANVRGVQVTDLAMEEADTNPVAVFTKGITRIDRYPPPDHFAHLPPEMRSYGQVSASYNAPDEENWTVRVIEAEGMDDQAKAVRSELDEQGIKITFFRQPGFGEDGCENLDNLKGKYYPRAIAAMKAEGRGNDVDRLIYNKIGYIRIGDPVFLDHFKPRIHNSPVPLRAIPGVPLRIGLDQGQFGAAVIGQFLAPFQWRILAELWFKKSVFAPDFGRALRALLDERFPGHPIYDPAFCDLAGNANESLEDVTWINEVSAAARLPIEPQRLGGNRLKPRLSVWRAAMDFNHFGEPGLLIDPSCKMIRRGLENDYVWAQEVDKAGNAERVPKKRGNRAADVIDAGGYMMLAESLPDGRPLTAALAEEAVSAMDHSPSDGGWSGGAGVQSYDFNPLEGF